MRRVKTAVSLSQAQERLLAYRVQHGFGPHTAARLAEIIWPDTPWVAPQGAGAAATRVLKRLGCHWDVVGENYGWMLYFNKKSA